MQGNNGKKYTYLLKGHEDLRQDERAMQLFGLVNNFLDSDRDCLRKDLHIVRYAVTPLSPSSGLIEWIPHCDTMHAVIKAYRQPRKIPIDLEHKMMLNFCPSLDDVPVVNKMEALNYALKGSVPNVLLRARYACSCACVHNMNMLGKNFDEPQSTFMYIYIYIHA